MIEVNVRDAREKLSALLDQVEQGEGILIKRHGKRVARLVPVDDLNQRLPSLNKFRESISDNGMSLRETVVQARESERY